MKQEERELSNSVSKFIPKYHESLQGKQLFDLKQTQSNKYVLNDDDLKIINELKAKAKEDHSKWELNTMQQVSSEKVLLTNTKEEKENLHEGDGSGLYEEDEEFIPSIKQINSENASFMKVSDLNIHDLCNLKQEPNSSKKMKGKCFV
jgi:hypothetical protein